MRMQILEKEKVSRVDRLFRAFSDRTRLRILHMLLDGELCVCDLVSVLNVPQPKVSRHLSYLRRSGLVQVRKEGLWCYYKLAPAKNTFHAKLLDCLGCCFDTVPEIQRDAGRLSKVRRKCCE
jgi:ArsR family transcriptional regulator